jgi:hypothetical protein
VSDRCDHARDIYVLGDEKCRHRQALRVSALAERLEPLVVDGQFHRLEGGVPRQHRRVPLDDFVETGQYRLCPRVAQSQAGGHRRPIPAGGRWIVDELRREVHRFAGDEVLAGDP